MQLKNVKTGQLVKDKMGDRYVILGISMIVTKANFVGCDEEARFYCMPEHELNYTKAVNLSDAEIKSNSAFDYVSSKYKKDVVKWLTKSMLQSSDIKIYFIEDIYDKIHEWYLDVHRAKKWVLNGLKETIPRKIMYEKDLKFGQLYCSKTSIVIRFDSSILGFAIYPIGSNQEISVGNLFRILLQYSELSLTSASHLSPIPLYDSGVNLYDLAYIKDTRGI